MPIDDDPFDLKEGDLKNVHVEDAQGGLKEVHVQASEGLANTGGLGGGSYRDPAQQRAFDKRQEQKQERAQEKGDEHAFGDDFSGRNGLKGVLGAVRQLASETAHRILGGFSIQGDNDIAVHGKGLSWKLALKRPPQLLNQPGSGLATIKPGAFACRKVNDTTIRVYFGQLNSQTPTGMSAGDTPVFTLTVSGTGNIYFKAKSAFNVSILDSIDILAGDPVPTSDDDYGYYSIGTYATDGGGKLTVADNGKVFSVVNANGYWIWWS